MKTCFPFLRSLITITICDDYDDDDNVVVFVCVRDVLGSIPLMKDRLFTQIF
jgi:hypothetical protein